MNTLANKITFLRLFFTMAFFGYVSAVHVEQTGFSIPFTFLVLACLDIVDGFIARHFNEESKLGRILDPLVDKILNIGTLILLLTLPPANEFIAPWMVILVFIREVLIHSIRYEIESRGYKFGANWMGKLKTFTQNFACAGWLFFVTNTWNVNGSLFCWLLVTVFTYLMIFMTVMSGIIYLYRAYKIWQISLQQS